MVDNGSLTVVAAGGGDGIGTGTGGGALRSDAGVSGSADVEDSRASMARQGRSQARCLSSRQERAELTVLKAIEELAIKALS